MLSSTCFEPEGSFPGRRLYVQVWYNMFIWQRFRQSCRWQSTYVSIHVYVHAMYVQSVPLTTKPGSSLIILLQTHSDTYRHNFTTDTFLFISHKTNVLLFKSRCNIFIGFGIIKELPGLVGSGTPCIVSPIF